MIRSEKFVEKTKLRSSLLQIEVIEEYFLYGLPNFIADIGGNLGLFLGCSILSMIEWFGEKFHCFKN